MKIIEGNVLANTSKIAIIISRVNRFVNNNLLEGTIDVLKRFGNVSDQNIMIIWVPGAYEIPLVVQSLAMCNQYDAVIVLGTIIKGLTAHFEFISRSCSSSLSKISIKHKLPIGLGILTTDNVEQAIERSGVKNNNKGSEAAFSVLEMINVLKMIDQ